MLILMLPGLLAACQAQSPVTAPAEMPVSAQDPFEFASKLLPEGKYKAQILANDFPPRVKELMNRMNEALKGKEAWFFEYREKHKGSGDVVPYHPDFGLTEQEYQYYSSEVVKGPRPMVVKEVPVGILHDGKIMRFNALDTLAPLNNLSIDLEKKELRFAGELIPYKDPAQNSERPNSGKWEGHQWRLEKPGLGQGNVSVYLVVLARLDNGRPMMRISIVDSENGVLVPQAQFLLHF